MLFFLRENDYRHALEYVNRIVQNAVKFVFRPRWENTEYY